MTHRSPARFLAPLAVLAAAGAVYLVVHSGLQDGASATTNTTTVRTTTHTRKPVTKKHTYVVRPGDTLSAIAARTGVALERLQELNPTIDPNSLHAGQKLKLRPAS